MSESSLTSQKKHLSHTALNTSKIFRINRKPIFKITLEINELSKGNILRETLKNNFPLTFLSSVKTEREETRIENILE